MKLIYTCEHIDKDRVEIVKEFFNPAHDGRFFLISEVCAECMKKHIDNESDEDLNSDWSKMNH